MKRLIGERENQSNLKFRGRVTKLFACFKCAYAKYTADDIPAN